MGDLRSALNSSTGRVVGAIVALLAIAALAWALRGTFGSDAAAANSRVRWFVCSETGKPFQIEIRPGLDFPVASPHSGKPTGFPAELCYWTREGTPKTSPTYVLMNGWLDKPEPTFCPDCGRLVTPLNPAPNGERPAPPTEAEMRGPGRRT